MTARVEPCDAVGDPVDVVVDRDEEVGERRGAAGTGDVEHVQESEYREVEVIGFQTGGGTMCKYVSSNLSSVTAAAVVNGSHGTAFICWDF